MRAVTWPFTSLSWCISNGTVVIIIIGSLVFSSLLFVSTEDAIGVAVRFLGSTLVCRIILSYELVGMRATVEVMH